MLYFIALTMVFWGGSLACVAHSLVGYVTDGLCDFHTRKLSLNPPHLGAILCVVSGKQSPSLGATWTEVRDRHSPRTDKTLSSIPLRDSIAFYIM